MNMDWETYIDDPELESTMRLCEDRAGMHYIFRANGEERIYDTYSDMMTAASKMIAEGMKSRIAKQFNDNFRWINEARIA